MGYNETPTKGKTMTNNSPIGAVKSTVAKLAEKRRHARVEKAVRKLEIENPGYAASSSFVNALKESSFTKETYAAAKAAR